MMFLRTCDGYITAMLDRPVPHLAVPYAAPIANNENNEKWNGMEEQRKSFSPLESRSSSMPTLPHGWEHANVRVTCTVVGCAGGTAS